MTTVMCFGTFDLLHLGHLDYFAQAKEHGDYLVVVVARDQTKQGQEKKVVFDEEERLILVSSLRVVDKAVLGNVENHFKIIEEVKPDVLCLGYDHQVKEKELAKKLSALGLHPKIVRAIAYEPHLHKSTRIKEVILKTQ
jgi:FAD synthetase